MEQQIFSDGIGQVTVIGGAVRLDLVTYSVSEKDAKGQPAAVFCQRVVMSLDGFMQSAVKIQEAAQAVSKLMQRARENQPADPVPASPAVPAAPAEAAKRPFP
jgi:hypothetical protein